MPYDADIDALSRPDRSIPRFFADPLPQAVGGQAVLPADQAKHATRVLRLTPGDTVQLLDGHGRVALATLDAPNAAGQSCTVTELRELDRPKPTIELATAIPKGPRADTMVNDLAQLGVDTLIPMTTRHSVVDPGTNKIERFNKAAITASKQSLRPWLMRVASKSAFEAALDCDADLKLIAEPDGQPFTGCVVALNAVSTVRILIGPEGGWHADEIAQAERAGFKRWCINPNVLRVETAAAAAVAVLRSNA